MQPLTYYRHTIISVLSTLAEARTWKASETVRSFDMLHDNYLLLDVGWDGMQRVHQVIAHLRICNGTIWIEADYSASDIEQQLRAAGVPSAAIMLTSDAPAHCSYTDAVLI